MGKIVLVTGGARSGKSTYAEEYAKKLGDAIVYIATGIPFDDEMKLRVQKHQMQRPSQWETVEAYKNLDKIIQAQGKEKQGFLLDCVTIMVTNIIMEVITDWEGMTHEQMSAAEAQVQKEILCLIEGVSELDGTLIAVTNEVGMGVVPEYASARLFRDMAGRANQLLAKAAEEVYFCVSGIPVRIK